MRLYEKPADNLVAFILIILIFSMMCSAYRTSNIQEKDKTIKDSTRIIESNVKLFNYYVKVRKATIKEKASALKTLKKNTFSVKVGKLGRKIRSTEVKIRIVIEDHHRACRSLKKVDKKLMEKLCSRVKPLNLSFTTKYTSCDHIIDPYTDYKEE